MIRRLAAGVLFAWLATATPALASPVLIDFGTGNAGAGGTITASGGNVTGSNILIGVMTVVGTAFDGVYQVVGGLLNFNTLLNTISITGSIPSLGIGPTTLLSGSFASWTLTGLGTPLAVFTGSGPDSKDPGLLAALGISPTQLFNFFGFTIGFDASGTGPTYTAFSTDISNTSAVPEVGTLLLLGSGLIGVAQRARSARRARKRAA